MSKVSKTVYIEKHLYPQLEQISRHTGYTISELIQNLIVGLCNSNLEELPLKILTTPREKVKGALAKKGKTLTKWCQNNNLDYMEVSLILHRLNKNIQIRNTKELKIVDKLRSLTRGE